MDGIKFLYFFVDSISTNVFSLDQTLLQELRKLAVGTDCAISEQVTVGKSKSLAMDSLIPRV